MYVRNRAGYTFSFKYRGKTIVIPNNNTIYSIPDDAGRYSELAVILPMNIRSQKVIYINVGGEEVDIQGHKRRGRPTGPTKKKPTPKVEKVEVPKTDVDNEKFNVNINLDFEMANVEKQEKLEETTEKVEDVKPSDETLVAPKVEELLVHVSLDEETVKDEVKKEVKEPVKKTRAKRGRPATKARSTKKKTTTTKKKTTSTKKK